MKSAFLDGSEKLFHKVNATAESVVKKLFVSSQRLTVWARSRATAVSFSLLALAVLTPVLWFYISLTTNVGAFDANYRVDLTAPLTSVRWFYEGKTYVVFAQDSASDLKASEVEFTIQDNASKNAVPLLSSFKHVELEVNGNLLKSFTRFRVPKSGPYEMMAKTPQGELHKLQIRMESPSTEKAQGMTYAFLLSALILSLIFYIQKPGKISKVSRMVKVQLVGDFEPLPRTFNHLNSRLRIETRQRFHPPAAINASHQARQSAKNPRV